MSGFDRGMSGLVVVVGVVIGMILMWMFFFLGPTTARKGADALIECEAALPRDQHCIITAIPAPNEDG